MKLLTTIYGNCDLTPHFIKHYEKLGVTSIHCVYNKSRHPQNHQKLIEYTKGTMFSIDQVIDEEYDTVTFMNHLDKLKNELIGPDEWYFKVDLDEFTEFLTPLNVLLENADKAGNNVLKGQWFDRIAANGSLAVIRQGIPIEEQFPLGGAISEGLAGSETVKSVVIKGNRLKLYGGCHYLENEKAHPSSCIIHHYKWTSTLLPRMQQRADHYKKMGRYWWDESKQIFDYFSEHGKLDVSNPAFNIRGYKGNKKHKLNFKAKNYQQIF